MRHCCPECGGRLSAELECLRCGEYADYIDGKIRKRFPASVRECPFPELIKTKPVDNEGRG
jgi:hypothetical protein